MIRLKHLLQEWTGESWKSYQQWRGKHTKFMSADGPAKITISSTPTNFTVSYIGHPGDTEVKSLDAYKKPGCIGPAVRRAGGRSIYLNLYNVLMFYNVLYLF